MRTKILLTLSLLLAATAVSGCRYGHPGHDSDHHGGHHGGSDHGGGDRHDH